MRTVLRSVLAAAMLVCLASAARAADVLLKDPDYKVLAVLKPDGTWADESGKVLGRFSRDGSILDASSHVLGHVTGEGVVKDASGKTLGRIREDGTVLAADRQILGYIAAAGLIQSASYDTAAHVEGAGWDPVFMAAFWFFFREQVLPKQAAPPKSSGKAPLPPHTTAK